MSSKNGRDSFLYSERLQYIRNVAASLLLRRGKLYAGGKPRRQRLGRQAGYDFDNVESDKWVVEYSATFAWGGWSQYKAGFLLTEGILLIIEDRDIRIQFAQINGEEWNLAKAFPLAQLQDAGQDLWGNKIDGLVFEDAFRASWTDDEYRNKPVSYTHLTLPTIA